LGQHQWYGIDAGQDGLGFTQGIQPGREGFRPGQGREQDFLVPPSVLGAPKRYGQGKRGVVEVLAEATLQQGIAITSLDIRQILKLEALFGGVGEQVKNARAMLLEIARQRFEAGRLIAEFGLDLDAAGLPALGGKSGAVGLQDAFGGHQVFILVMMS
jgi:hypothetical protein